MTKFDILNPSGKRPLEKNEISDEDLKRKKERYDSDRAIVEENTKELRSRLELEQTISKKTAMQISSIVRKNEGILCTRTVLLISSLLYDQFSSHYIKLLRRIYHQCLPVQLMTKETVSYFIQVGCSTICIIIPK